MFLVKGAYSGVAWGLYSAYSLLPQIRALPPKKFPTSESSIIARIADFCIETESIDTYEKSRKNFFSTCRSFAREEVPFLARNKACQARINALTQDHKALSVIVNSAIGANTSYSYFDVMLRTNTAFLRNQEPKPVPLPL